MKSFKMNLSGVLFLMIFILCMLVAVVQGSSVSSELSRNAVIGVCVLPIIIMLVFFGFLYISDKGKITEEKVVFAVIFAAMLLHCCYVLLSGIHDRQHDEGVYTGIASSQINPGHLGYIEYIYKFHKLPNLNPYELFSYYHPPLHFVVSALWLILLTALGMPEDFAFENLQILPLFYSGLLMLVTYKILKKIGCSGKGLCVGLFLVAMHPALTIMSGSINNDMLSVLLMACNIWAVISYIQERSLKNLFLIAFSIGFGMLCKVHAAVIALPTAIVFLMDFINVIRGKNKKEILIRIRNYILFGITSAVIGLAWIVHNLVSFHENPGVPVPGVDSVLYTGDYGFWARLGIPAMSDWHFDFPFHPLSGDAINNIWVIMFQTSLFAEEYPEEISGLPFMLCKIVYVAAIISAIAAAVLFLFTQYQKYRHSDSEGRLTAVFMSVGYVAFLIGFAAFAVKYPYTCSSDFRYMVICLIYMAVGLAESTKVHTWKKVSAGEFDTSGKIYSIAAAAVRIAVCAVIALTAIIYLIWKQW